MTGADFKRLLRAILFLSFSLIILLIGILPGDFSQAGFQVSPIFFAWTAAFILRRPGSVGVFVIILAALQYIVYNDEGVTLGALTYLVFALLAHELREYLVHQSFAIDWLSMSILYFILELVKNMLLNLFFSYHFPILEILKYSLYFAIAYPIFSGLIFIALGKRSSKQITIG